MSLTQLLPTKGNPASLSLVWSLGSVSVQSKVESMWTGLNLEKDRQISVSLKSEPMEILRNPQG